VDSSREQSASRLPAPFLPGSLSEISKAREEQRLTHEAIVATQITNEALLAACYIRARFCHDGKGDFICNQDITFIEKLFREYPDKKHIQDLYQTAFDKVREEQLPDDKWLHLVSIFRGYFGIVTYPDLPEGTPVIIPS
jgi:hypothetical protein